MFPAGIGAAATSVKGLTGIMVFGATVSVEAIETYNLPWMESQTRFCGVTTPTTGFTNILAAATAEIVKTFADDVPPPAVVLVTVTFAVPVKCRSMAGIVAVIWVALTLEDVSAAPFQRTIEPFLKFEPYKVKLTAELPAGTLEGAMAVSEGMSGGGPLPVLLLPGEFPLPQDAVRRIVPARPAVAKECHTRCNPILDFIERYSVHPRMFTETEILL